MCSRLLIGFSLEANEPQHTHHSGGDPFAQEFRIIQHSG